MASPAAGLPALDGPPLRVLLRRGSEGLKVAAPGGLRLCGLDGKTLAELSPRGRAGLSARAGRLAMDGSSLGVSEALVLPVERDEIVRVGGRRYRGRMALLAKGSSLALVNIVGLEDYLRGVLPSEVAASGPPEALKAQAVAARSFAVTQMQASASKTWDLDNSADSQVYRGQEEETEATDRAVQATRGIVLAWRDAVAHTFFHSNSGGHTAGADEVWGGPVPPLYLQGVMDTWSEDQGHYRWSATMGREAVERRLEKAGLWSGFLEDVVARDRSDSERWTRVELLGHQGQIRTISANDFRKVLGPDLLRSTRFTVRLRGDEFQFDGLGWGHGVGLSQEGAFAMARAGRDYRGILDFYYPGTRRATLQE
jgi:stage II sporulation protein D